MQPLASESPILVVDAGVAVTSGLDIYLSQATERAWEKWRAAGAELFAPQLWLYEVTAMLRKALALGRLSANEAEQGLSTALALEINLIPADGAMCHSALRFAERLGHTVTYDSFYLALANQLQAEFWTTDQRLVNAARQSGIRWTHWIGEFESKQA